MVYIYGIHSCAMALQNPKRIVEKIWLSNETLIQKLPPLGKHKWTLVDKSFFNQLVPRDAVHQGVIIQVQPLPPTPLDFLQNDLSLNQVVLFLDQVNDPHNVGAIMRSCAIFGVKAIVLPHDNSPQESGVLAKSASGALELIPIIKVVNISQSLKQLKQWGFWCYGLDEKGEKMLHQKKMSGKIALILGAEGGGMRQLTKANCDEIFKLPASSQFTTLNVSNATAIVLYEIYRQCNGNI